MYAVVDANECIGCGSCEAVCPEVFRLNDEGKAEAYAEVTDELKDTAQEAIDICPVKCIAWDED